MRSSNPVDRQNLFLQNTCDVEESRSGIEVDVLREQPRICKAKRLRSARSWFIVGDHLCMQRRILRYRAKRIELPGPGHTLVRLTHSNELPKTPDRLIVFP